MTHDRHAPEIAHRAVDETERRTTDRPQTLGEEIANAITHGLGAGLAIASLPILVVHALRTGGGDADVTGAALFGGTAVVLYLVSTIYHALPPSRAKALFVRFDHAAIFLFIAGSYMPFVLGAMRGTWGWILFGLVWSIAAVGVTAKLLDRLRHPLWSTGLYLAMGWCVLVAIVPLVTLVSPAGLAWLVAGGVCYSIGAVVFLFDSRVRYAHLVWHLFVIAGSVCHFFAALWHARGAGV